MSNVISLSERPVVTEVNEAAVAELERLLQMAKDGQAVGLAWVALRTDGRPDCGWTECPDGMSYGLGIVGLTYKYGQGAWEE